MEHIELSDIQGDRSIENQKISLLNSLSLSADSVKSAINKVIDSDNEKLPLSGGVVSGDIGTTESISCVSYLQTDATGYMQNYCSRGGHLETSKGKYTDFRPLGVSFYKPSKVGGCVGAMGYCMLSGCNDPETGNGVLKLSGDAAPLKEAVRQLSAKTDQFKWSISLDSGCDCYAYNIDPQKIEDVYADDGKTISATIVGLKQPIAANTLNSFKSTEAEMLALWENQVENEDDNCFYCPTVPEAGNQLVPVFYGAHAEGCMSRAIQRATHAEGRSCLADGRYSHAEGMNTIAGNVAAHSEGALTFAHGSNSHAEGYGTLAKGEASHAEGFQCYANGKGSHSSGIYAVAQGTYSYVWNGVDGFRDYGKTLVANGVYAVNPKNGINGFYIGTQTLSAIISSAIDAALKAKGL